MIYPSVFDLFINLGGALSLWMGLSFIMVVEVFEILVDLFINCLSSGGEKRRDRTHRRKNSVGASG